MNLLLIFFFSNHAFSSGEISRTWQQAVSHAAIKPAGKSESGRWKKLKISKSPKKKLLIEKCVFLLYLYVLVTV